MGDEEGIVVDERWNGQVQGRKEGVGRKGEWRGIRGKGIVVWWKHTY